MKSSDKLHFGRLPAIHDTVEFEVWNDVEKLNKRLCDKCGKTSSRYLYVYIDSHPATVCKECLLKGVEMIDKEMMK